MQRSGARQFVDELDEELAVEDEPFGIVRRRHLAEVHGAAHGS
jgi:hypothetical protein